MTKRNDCDEALELAISANYFCAPGGAVFADIDVRGHRETWELDSANFQDWLRNAFYDDIARALRPDALKSAILMLKARAQKLPPGPKVYTRIAELDDCLYLDLCNSKWQVVRISAEGWSVVQKAPVRFRRTAGMMSLPVPKSGGSINDIHPFLGKMSEDNFVLLVAWALMALRGRSPYPLLCLSGPQGSAKSTTARIMQRLIDPSHSGLRVMPTSERHLFMAARHHHVLSFDNLSTMSASISDSLCRLSSGASYVGALHYSAKVEHVMSAAAPIILNGIVNVIEKPDLAERGLFIKLQPPAEGQRQSEQYIDAAFSAAHPRLLGALLDGLVEGLKNRKKVAATGDARMHDFVQWSAACETAYWPAGTFEAAYRGMAQQSAEDFAETDCVIDALMSYLAETDTFRGTAQILLNTLTSSQGNQIQGNRRWPKCAETLSKHLRRIEPVLRSLGVDADFEQKDGRNRNRIIEISVRKATADKAVLAPPAAMRQQSRCESSTNTALQPPGRSIDAAEATKPVKRRRQNVTGAHHPGLQLPLDLGSGPASIP